MRAPTIAAAPRLRRGSRLGKYLLVSRLGEGGFSEVWKAKDTIEGQLVALKVPHPHLVGSDAEGDLLEEIRLSARLDHPNILRIRNADRVGALYVIASDLAVESLEERLRRRLATRRALAYLQDMLAGLAYAHENRVIHRDLKPGNLMIFAGDRIRVADFGLAKVTRQSMVSATGSGTLLYLAPEQAHGYPCFASDVFSVGLVAHQMLTGVLPRWPYQWPFPGERTLRSKLPPEVVNIIRKATRPDRRQRYHDAGEMLGALERAQPAVQRFLDPRPPRRRRRPPRLGAWKELRFRECEKAFGRRLGLGFVCPACEGPISEHMAACPWCGLEGIQFGEESDFPRYCARCRHGLLEEWPYCPWCWGPAFPDASGETRPDPRYRTSCGRCGEPMMDGMRYCPWCHARRTRPVLIEELPDRCPHCKSSVVAALWQHCPWCARPLASRP